MLIINEAENIIFMCVKNSYCRFTSIIKNMETHSYYSPIIIFPYSR